MHRIIPVSKGLYASIVEALRPDERIIGPPSNELWTVDLESVVDMRFPDGLVLYSVTPEGVRQLYFMRAK